ncbi:WUSCHEL-related homeobox 11 isoform X1 [Solanum lycopersicum]|uniref:WUSCHEL-related homeobox 11 isoform X1 n=1 Tax=Solanum lycopersicum TaxID=4081 RepID=UPI0002BCAAF7|nr:WUSCHEL-related homeobox 11 isoform X1 [Solanum lycopersicum]
MIIPFFDVILEFYLFHSAMDDDSSSSSQSCERNETVRSRWNPKPEQIVILESIFNSGMVNPRKDETVRIRKMLEQFGAVGDANVFYWFQNRRSRSRRRQRQIQASLSAVSNSNEEQSARSSDGGAIQFQTNFVPSSVSSSSSSLGGVVGNANDGLFLFSGPMGIDQNSSITSILCSPTDNSNLNCSSSGFITVFINGVAAQVPRGPLDMKAMFGPEDLVLYHSSGVPLPVNEYGFVVQSLQHGESYFLVSSHQPQVAGGRVSNKNMN